MFVPQLASLGPSTDHTRLPSRFEPASSIYDACRVGHRQHSQYRQRERYPTLRACVCSYFKQTSLPLLER
jgi:hypothetical protein